MNTTEIPILENAEDREYYGRSATEIKSVVDIIIVILVLAMVLPMAVSAFI